MGVQDHIRTVGLEGSNTWGTRATTLTKGVAHKFSNEPSPTFEEIESRGMVPNQVGLLDTQVIPTGRASGSVPIVVDLWNKTHGYLLADAGSSIVTTTPVGGTLTRLHTITPTTTGPTRSRTIHDEIPEADGGTTIIDYLGCMLASLELSTAPKQAWQLKADYSLLSVDESASSVTPAYASTPFTYKDNDTTTTLDSVAICPRTQTHTIPTGLKMDLDRSCSDGRRKPVVTGLVNPTGTIGTDYNAKTTLTKWRTGVAVPLVVYIQGPIIEGSLRHFLRLTYPLVRYTGAPIDRAEDDLPSQNLPYRAVGNGTDPMWTIEYQTTDTTDGLVG